MITMLNYSMLDLLLNNFLKKLVPIIRLLSLQLLYNNMRIRY